MRLPMMGLLPALAWARDACPTRCTGGRDDTGLPSLSGQVGLPLHSGLVPPRPQQIGKHTFLLHDLLTAQECDAIISAAERTAPLSPERISFGYWANAYDSVSCAMKPCVSSRDVMRFEDHAFATALAARLQAVLPALVAKNGTRHMGRVGRLVGLNSAMRVARYSAGDQLPTHTDHVTYAGPTCCSAWTLTIYLNTVDSAHGGSTDFEHAAGVNMDVRTVQPRAGTGVLLAHDVLHSGSVLLHGYKYILRTEPLYWSGAPVSGGLIPREYELHWPGPPPSASGSGCALEHVHASERECPSCS